MSDSKSSKTSSRAAKLYCNFVFSQGRPITVYALLAFIPFSKFPLQVFYKIATRITVLGNAHKLCLDVLRLPLILRT